MPESSTHIVWYVVKVPTALGIVRGVKGEVLSCEEDKTLAQSFAYDAWTQDKDHMKVILYEITVVECLEDPEGVRLGEV